MNKSIASMTSLAAFLLTMPASARAQKLPWHTKHTEAVTGVTRVLLVPPDVRVDQWSTTSGRELAGTADYLQRTICGTLDQQFEEKKILVSDYPLCLGEGESSVERRDAIAAARARFRELVTAWMKPRRPSDLLEEFHLGEEGEAIKKLEVDALILVCADGNLKTKGERIMGGLNGGAPSEGVLLHVGMIQPRTGQLVFFTEKDVGGDFLKHPERLETAIEKCVQAALSLPGASTKEPAR